MTFASSGKLLTTFQYGSAISLNIEEQGESGQQKYNNLKKIVLIL